MTGKKVHYEKGLRIGTRCETVDEFIDTFYRLCEDSLIFIPHAKRPIGTDVAFSFDLADGRVALCGVGVVLEQLTDTSNRFSRPGSVIEVRQLQTDSKLVFEQMSTKQRARRRNGTVTTPPPASAPASPRSISAIPSYRPRAVTSAIEIDSAIAIAKEAAAAKSGGLPKPAPTNAPIAVPRSIPSTSRAAPAAVPVEKTPARLPPPPRVAPASSISEPARVAPTPSISEPPRLAPAPSISKLPGVAPASSISKLPGVAPAPSITAPPPVAPVPSIAEQLQAIATPQPPTTSASSPPPRDVLADNAVVDNVKWDASAAVVVPADLAPQRAALPARIVAAARTIYRRIVTRSRVTYRTGAERWRAATPRRRWLVGGGTAAATLLLMIALVKCASKPSPVAARAAATIGSAAEPAKPPVEAPATNPPVAKTPVSKKKPVATKRVATSKSATKRPTKRKPATKPTGSTPVRRKHCSAKNC